MTIAFPHPPGAGGPGSFQVRFENELRKMSVTIVYAHDHIKPDIVFIVGGTQKLLWLYKMKLKGVPILFRLDGISWLHRKKTVGIRKYFLAEFRNLIMKFIHAYLADRIVYQSQFIKNWWDKISWVKRDDVYIIYNGVKPHIFESIKDYKIISKRLVILEGNIDYTPYSLWLLNNLAESLPIEIEIELYGNFEFTSNEKLLHKRIKYNKFIKREDVFKILHGSVYFSLDIHPACPNTVIEAMSVGAPVVSFDTGSIMELVDVNSGIIVSYGSDSWNLDFPDISSLRLAILETFENYNELSLGSKNNFNKKFTISEMCNRYMSVIGEMVSKI